MKMQFSIILFFVSALFATCSMITEKEFSNSKRSLGTPKQAKNGLLTNIVDLLLGAMRTESFLKEYNDIKKKLKYVMEELNEIKRAKKNIIAFTATSRTRTATVNGGQVVPFKKLIKSFGGGFNETDGIFYCPEEGLYQFSASITIIQPDIWISFRKNGAGKETIFKDYDAKWGAASGSMIVWLKKGDRVWMTPNKKITMWENVSLFSGIRIFS